MTTYNYSAIANNALISFAPGDVLHFNSATISATDVDIWPLNSDGTNILVEVRDSSTGNTL